MCKFIYMHTNIYSFIHTCIYAGVHIHYRCTSIGIYTYAHKYAYTYRYNKKHAQIHMYRYTFIYSSNGAHMPTWVIFVRVARTVHASRGSILLIPHSELCCQELEATFTHTCIYTYIHTSVNMI